MITNENIKNIRFIIEPEENKIKNIIDINDTPAYLFDSLGIQHEGLKKFLKSYFIFSSKKDLRFRNKNDDFFKSNSENYVTEIIFNKELRQAVDSYFIKNKDVDFVPTSKEIEKAIKACIEENPELKKGLSQKIKDTFLQDYLIDEIVKSNSNGENILKRIKSLKLNENAPKNKNGI